MKMRTIVILVLVALAAVIIIQNSGPTALRLLFWPIYAPLFILVLLVFLIGFVAGLLFGRRGRDRARPDPARPVPPVTKP